MVRIKNNLFFIDTEETQIKRFKKDFNGYLINLPKKNLYNPLFDLKKYIYQNFHFLGNLLGLKCRRCQHLTSSHEGRENEIGVWKCAECELNDNICEIGDKDIREVISYIKTGIKTYIKYTDKINYES